MPKISGVIYNQDGSAKIARCDVFLIRESDHVLVRKTTSLADGSFSFVIPNVTDTYLVVANSQRMLAGALGEIVGYLFSTWTETGVDVYTDANAQEKEVNGYWTDASGRADPADAASANYKWQA